MTKVKKHVVVSFRKLFVCVGYFPNILNFFQIHFVYYFIHLIHVSKTTSIRAFLVLCTVSIICNRES